MWYDLIYVCKRHSFSVIGVNYYVQNALNMQVMELKQRDDCIAWRCAKIPFL